MTTLPNFLVIGAAKSGTTALHHYLKQHPGIFLSKIKEPRFFAFEEQKLDFRGPGDRRYQQEIVSNFEDYCNLFNGAAENQAVGEMSPLYLSQPGTAARIARRLPEAKLIVILRHPAERAYSQFLMHRRDGHEPLGDFAEALAAEPQRIEDNWLPIWFYRRRGFYFQQLSSYYECFPGSRIRVFLYEDFVANPLKLIRDICDFLGVESDFVPDMSFRPNTSRMPRSRFLNKILITPHPVKTALEKILSRNFRDRVRRRLLELNSTRAAPLDENLRRRLIADYRDDILQLQKLIGRDLTHWIE
jgi:hypothetical protein